MTLETLENNNENKSSIDDQNEGNHDGSNDSDLGTGHPPIGTQNEKQYDIVYKWDSILGLAFVHVVGLLGLAMYLFRAHFCTLLLTDFVTLFLGMGITAGAHRLWTHRAYEASLPLRIYLMLGHCAMMQKDLYEWCRDHRVHHKYSDTDADPHNATRGFFFSHIGWLMCKKHPDVIAKCRAIDLSDLKRDPVVRFQRRYYIPLALFWTFGLPCLLPYYLWNESLVVAFLVAMFRFLFNLHITLSVNSFAHLYGYRPYDAGIYPTESKLVQIMTVGEGYHNYHHAFPYDYSASELSWTHDVNITTWFIDCCVSLGLASNTKKVDPKIIRARIQRTGNPTEIEKYRATREEAGLSLRSITKPSTFYNSTYLLLLTVLLFVPAGVFLSRLITLPIIKFSLQLIESEFL